MEIKDNFKYKKLNEIISPDLHEMEVMPTNKLNYAEYFVS